MPEGPEVRKFADSVGGVLTGRVIRSIDARTREAKNWLTKKGHLVVGRRVISVRSHGKHLFGEIEGGYYFHSHLMMWGRWLTFVGYPPAELDRRERARIVVKGGAAILYSGPIFNVGEGDPRSNIEHLDSLGPDVLPYDGIFDAKEFRRRLTLPEYHDSTIGAALLNQRIVAGLGNYLRAEVLFACGLNPWRLVGELKKNELMCLSSDVPEVALRSYLSGATASEIDRERMKTDPSLVYQQGREMGTRHLVFRRTNLPCLRCSHPIRQCRQAITGERPIPTPNGQGGNKTVEDRIEVEESRFRITYFCAHCQNVEITQSKPKRPKNSNLSRESSELAKKSTIGRRRRPPKVV